MGEENIETKPLTVQMLSILFGIAAGSSVFVAYAYSNFVSKNVYDKDAESMERRLARIESKIDTILEGKKSR